MNTSIHFKLFILFLSVPASYESRVFGFWLRGLTGQHSARIVIPVAVCEMRRSRVITITKNRFEISPVVITVTRLCYVHAVQSDGTLNKQRM